MRRRRHTILVVMLLVLALQHVNGADPSIKVVPDNPQPGQELIVFLAPDFEDTAGGTSIPDRTTYTWTVTPTPTTPWDKGKPFIKLSGPADQVYSVKVVKTDTMGDKTLEQTITVGPSDQVDLSLKSSDADLAERLGVILTDLKTSTPEFSKVCTEIADAIKRGIDSAGNDVTKLQNDVRFNVRQAIKSSDNLPSETVRQAWASAYNQLITQLGSNLNTFEKKSNAYLIGIKVLMEAAKLPGSDLPGAISADALDGERISLEIVNTLREKPLELLKLDTRFERTCRSLIAALEDIVQEANPATTSVSDYKEKSKAAVLNVIQESKQAQVVQERWHQAYNIFLDRVSKSTILDDTKSEDWEKAIAILIAGLKKAIGVEAAWIEELKRNQGRRTGATGTAAAVAGSSSGYGNTIHGVITARKVQRIRNRAAVSRARIQRIQGQ